MMYTLSMTEEMDLLDHRGYELRFRYFCNGQFAFEANFDPNLYEWQKKQKAKELLLKLNNSSLLTLT